MARANAPVAFERHAVLESKLQLREDELDRSFRETVRTLMRVLAHRDEASAAHGRRMGLYTSMLAQQMGLDGEFCRRIEFASQLHDIGNIAVPDRILKKPGRLDADDRQAMKQHTVLGARMLGHNASPYLTLAVEIAATHHERWNGSGYPDRLAGEAIPLSARITGLCDSYDALRSARPYRKGMDHRLALQAVLAGNADPVSRLFDPAVLAAFEASRDLFRDVFETIAD